MKLMPHLCLMALLACATPGHANTIGPLRPLDAPPPQALPACETTNAQNNCVRLLACIGREGRWFSGRSFGRGAGTLAGTTNDGVACTGDWISRNRLGVGQADVSCDDGMAVRVFFTYQEHYTGTTIGRGLSNTGAFVKAWSGLHVLDYLEEETGKVNTLPCGPDDVLISRAPAQPALRASAASGALSWMNFLSQ